MVTANLIQFPTSIAYTLITHHWNMLCTFVYQSFSDTCLELQFFWVSTQLFPVVLKSNWWLIIFMKVTPAPIFFFTPNLITTKIQITSAMSIVFCFPQVVWGLTRRDVIEVRITAGGRIHHNLRHVISRKSRGILKTHRCWSQTIHNCMMEILWHEI